MRIPLTKTLSLMTSRSPVLRFGIGVEGRASKTTLRNAYAKESKNAQVIMYKPGH